MSLRKKSIPSDERRCMHTNAAGSRCRYPRLEGHSLCSVHDLQATREAQELQPFPAFVAAEILPPDATLDSAAAINATLTRVFRCVCEGRLTPRHAASLGYLGQLIIATLPGLERAAANQPPHPLLGRDPDAALANLVHSLSAALPQPDPPATPPAHSSPDSAETAGSHHQDHDAA